jgi:hypothetical protein
MECILSVRAWSRYALNMNATGENSNSPIPTISHLRSDGTIVEALFDEVAATTSLAVRAPDGTTSIQPYIDLPTGARLIPYSPKNNLIVSGCVLLPSDVGDVGD